MNGISFPLSPHGRYHQSASEYFLLTPGISSFLMVPSAASICAETCLPSLAELLLSCGEVYPKIFPSPLKCLSEWSLNMPLPAPVRLCPRAPVPGQGTQELPTPYRVCWAMEAQERGRSFCLLPFKVRKACSGPHDCLPHFSYLLKPMGLGGGGCWSPA